MTEVRVPDIGDFQDVPIIEIHVSPGDEVAVEDPLVTLESDKATMDVPAPEAGTVKQLSVKIGDRVSEGSVLLILEGAEDGAASSSGEKPAAEDGAGEKAAGEDGAGEKAAAGDGAGEKAAAEPRAGEKAAAGDGAGEEAAAKSGAGASVQREPAPPPPSASADGAGGHDAQVVVIGSGPGGYTAAFRAADLGLKTVLIERYDRLGGVCLNVGCIPSKALLHAARVVNEAEEMAEHGIKLGKPKVDLDALRAWKESVVGRLTGGLAGLAKQRKVEVITGSASLTGPHTVAVGDRTVSFDNCIIAAGSEAATLPGWPEDERIIDSTGALELPSVPKRLLVVGCGIIGLEMATVYHALGAKVTMVELLDQLIPGSDPDLVKPLHKRISGRYEAIHLGTKVESVDASKDTLHVQLSSGDKHKFDGILVAIGRRPNGRAVGASEAGVEVDDAGFIGVDRQMRTNVPHIYAIGDVVGGPMLAHKASHEGKVAAEVIAGIGGAEFDPRAIPSVAYTDPEVAWMGLTETEAREQGVEYEKATFPWAASGRALSLGRDEGMTKLLFEPGSRRLLGAGIVGVNAGELIAETVHALEMGADAEDIALTIHPHPTLTETIGFAAEMAEGTITDLMPPRKRERAKA
jgi:dihydrolipoamide dehydrogenase